MLTLPKTAEPASDASSESDCGPFWVRLEKAALRVGTRRVLKGTSWTLRPGEQWLIWGPNGSGKTTLAGAVAGDIPVVEGRRRFGRTAGGRPVVSRISFDEHALIVAREDARDLSRDFAGRTDGELTARNLLKNLGSPEVRTAILGWAGIAHLADQPVRTLSTGEMRKLLVARALLRNPDLLILDEPFDGLDAASRADLAGRIGRLMDTGLHVVLITHRRSEILPGITHVIAVDDGRVVYKGPLADWKRSAPVKDPKAFGGECPVGGLPGRSNRTEAILRLERVTVRYGDRTVFRDLDWTMRAGENWLISGPNGAGKTTLICLVSGSHPQAYANRIFLFGQRRGTGETIWDIRSRIGQVSPELQVHYRRAISGLDAVVSGFYDSIGLYRRASGGLLHEAACWLERLGIAHLGGRRFDRLSTGERRMLLLARAVVKGPELLILDEPCQGLDGDNRRQILALVDRIVADPRTSLIYVTHHRDERPGCITHELSLPAP